VTIADNTAVPEPIAIAEPETTEPEITEQETEQEAEPEI
jgi:hypothetical protein